MCYIPVRLALLFKAFVVLDDGTCVDIKHVHGGICAEARRTGMVHLRFSI